MEEYSPLKNPYKIITNMTQEIKKFIFCKQEAINADYTLKILNNTALASGLLALYFAHFLL